MNIIRYKNIDELIKKKDVYLAQEIDSDQLKLISKGYVPTDFNTNENDVLEFVLYDKNNIILPQESFGTVRHIKGDKIKDYLLPTQNTSDTIYENGGFLIDAKKLIREAGYTTGYFRVQFNFVTNRVGSDIQNQKLWVQEISPSRLEMRLLPYNNFSNPPTAIEAEVKKKLNVEYDTFLNGKFFYEDFYQEVSDVLDSIKSRDVENIMKTVLTTETINKLSQEFNITGGFEKFYDKVILDMKNAVLNRLLYKESTIGSPEFGKNLLTNNSENKKYNLNNWYNKQDVIKLIEDKFKESLVFNLPKRSLNNNVVVNKKTEQSLDELNKIIQTNQSVTAFQLPKIEREILQAFTVAGSQPSTQNTTNNIPPPPPPIPPLGLTFTFGPTVKNVSVNGAELVWGTNFGSSAVITFENNCPDVGCAININNITQTKNYQLINLAPSTEYTFYITCLRDGKIVDTVKSTKVSFKTLPAIIRNEDFTGFTPTTETSPTQPPDYSGGGGFVRTTTTNYLGNQTYNYDVVEGSIQDYTDNIK